MRPDDSPRDLWEDTEVYELFMGRWSRKLTHDFVSWLGVPVARYWLEVGCGTGALTSQILRFGNPAPVLATDSSEQFIQQVQSAFQDDRDKFLTASADDLPTNLKGFDEKKFSPLLTRTWVAPGYE